MISVFLCLSLGLLPSAPVTSEIIWYTGPMPLTRDTIDKRGGQKVVRLIIEGVCEQNKHIVRAIMDIRSGEHLASVNPELIKKNLAETGLFSQAEIFYRPTMHGIILTLSLKEKKQALGLPSFRLSESDVYSGGAFFREDPVAISAERFNSEVWQAGGLNGFIKYKNPELKGRNQKMEILFRGKFETRTQTLADESPIRRFRGYSGHLEMQWGFQTDARFRPTFLLFYDMFDVDTTWKENLEPPDTAELIGTGIKFEYDNYYFVYFFDEGIRATLTASRTQHIVDNVHAYTSHLNLERNSNPLGDHRLQTAVRAGYNPVPSALKDFLQGPGHYLLPPKKSVDLLYTSTIGAYEIPLKDMPWGTLTFFTFLEGGVFRPDSEHTQFYFGPGIGQHLFLKRLSRPILRVTLGYNILHSYLSAKLSAGIRF